MPLLAIISLISIYLIVKKKGTKGFIGICLIFIVSIIFCIIGFIAAVSITLIEPEDVLHLFWVEVSLDNLMEFSILSNIINIVFAPYNINLGPSIAIIIESFASLGFSLLLVYYRKEIRDYYYNE